MLPEFIVNDVPEQGSHNQILRNASGVFEVVHTYVGVIQQGVFCQVAGDNFMEVKRQLQFLKIYYEVIADVQSDYSTHPFGTLSAAFYRYNSPLPCTLRCCNGSIASTGLLHSFTFLPDSQSARRAGTIE